MAHETTAAAAPGGGILQVPLAELRRRTSVKWRTYQPDVLPVWVAEMDAWPCEPVVDAVDAAMRGGDTGYAWPEAYAAATAAFAERRWGWRFDPAVTRTVPDVMRGAAEVLALVTDPGGPVVVNPPVYPPFYAFVELAGRRVVEAPLDDTGRLDPAALTVAFGATAGRGERTAYLLCNPHNPTGTAHTPDELGAVAGLAREHGVRVVSDEIHAPLVPPGHRHTPYLTVPGTPDAVALLSASKAWNLAGLKAALAVPAPEAVATLAGLSEMVGHGVSHLGVIAQTAALEHGEPWLDRLLVELDGRRELLTELLAQRLPEVPGAAPEATYLAWLDCRRLGLGDDPAAYFLEHGRVALNSGLPFGPGGAGHARLNLATSEAVLTEAVDRIAGSL